MMADDPRKLVPSSSDDINAFLEKVAQTPVVRKSSVRGKLIFAMDATASRESTWDQACHLQAEMFNETASLGGLDIQLCYYRGYGEFDASPWYTDSSQLLSRMMSVNCLGGHTQIEKVFKHAINETKKNRINALVFVGDCLEEDIDRLSQLAGELSLLGVPLFIFQEGYDPVAMMGFRQLAKLTSGAYSSFDSGSAQQLKTLLSAVAVYAAGGYQALENFNKRQGRTVLQIPHKKT